MNKLKDWINNLKENKDRHKSYNNREIKLNNKYKNIVRCKDKCNLPYNAKLNNNKWTRMNR